MRPIDAATLKLLEDLDDTHLYVHELLKTREGEHIDENFSFLNPKNPRKEDDHTPIQRCILNEIREFIKKRIRPHERRRINEITFWHVPMRNLTNNRKK